MTKAQSLGHVENGALIHRLLAAFEQARKVDADGREYWLAREYADILGYAKWQKFETLIDRAKAALAEEGQKQEDHFTHVGKMIEAGKGAHRDVGDIELTRRACYLIGINGDPRKKATIAAVQRYFAEQTRKQEITDMLQAAGADADRVAACRKLAETEQELRATVSPRLTRPEQHFEKIKRRGHHALFNKSPDTVKEDLGIPHHREISDFVRPVIVKGMDFAVELTTEQVRANPSLKGVTRIGDANEENHAGVRHVMTASGVIPETLPPAGDVRDVQARLEKQRVKLAARTASE